MRQAVAVGVDGNPDRMCSDGARLRAATVSLAELSNLLQDLERRR